MTEAPLRILVGAFGTLGEIHPLHAVARTLAARGHDVRLLAPAKYAPLAERAGIAFSALGDPAAFERFLAQKHLWHPLLAYPLLARGLAEVIAPAFRAVHAQHEPGRTVLALSWMLFGARIAAEQLNIPVVTLHLAPVILRGAIEPPRIAPLPLSRTLPPWWNRLWFGAIDATVDRLFADPINAFRQQLGLGPVRRVLGEWVHARERTIGLFPEWFAPPQPDWPPQTVLTGFPLYDGAETAALAPEIEAFLAAGSPPVVVSAGSEMRHAFRFFRTAMAACLRLGRRVVLLSPHPQHLPEPLPRSVIAARYAAHSLLLPRCAAIIHHGGIGTAAQALRAGVPQLVVPATFDQGDNGARLERLGVGCCIPAWRFNLHTAAAALRRLFDAQSLAACAAARSRFTGQDPLAETAALIEQAALTRTHA